MWSDATRWIVLGPWVSGALHALAAAVGAGAGPAVARALVRRRNGRARRALGEALSAVPAGEGHEVALAGELVAEGPAGAVAAVTVARHDPLDGAAQEPASGRLPGLALRCDNGLVRLDGAVTVYGPAVGPGAEDEALLGAEYLDGATAGVRARARVGDRVIVRGVLATLGAGAAEAGGYRGARPGWALSAGVAGRVLLQALPEVRGRTKAAVGFGALAAVAAMHLALTVAGGLALREARQARAALEVLGSRTFCVGGGQRLAAWATAAPWWRRAALDEQAVQLRCARARGPGLGALLGAIAAASGQSRVAQGHARASVGDVAGAAAVLAQAAEPEARREAAGWYLALGEFSRASALLGGLDAATLSGEMNAVASAHLLAGDLPRAAETLRAWARRLDRAHSSQSLLRQLRALNCLAGLLAQHATWAPREAGFDAEGRCVMGYDPAVHAEAERTLAAEERVRMRARLEVAALERPRPPAEDADLDAWMDRTRVPHDPALRQWLRARDKAAVARWLRTRAPTPRSALAIAAAAQRLGALDPVDLQSLVETELPWRVPFEPFATAALGREVAALLHAQGHRTALAEHAARVARLERAVSDDVVLLAWRLVARY